MSADRATPQLNLRADSRAQIERWRAAAKLDRRTLSGWIRLTLDAAAEAAEQKEKR